MGTIINIVQSLLGTQTAFPPFYMQIEPTNRCNLDCIMCGRQGFDGEVKYGDMKLEDFVAIVEHLPSLKYLNLSGYGEPLLNKDFIGMVEYAKSRKIDVETISNATLITKPIAQKIIRSGLDRIYISIDSFDRQTYVDIRKGDLNSALAGLENLIEAKRMGSSKVPRIIINTVLMKQNETQIEDIIHLMSGRDVELNFKSLGANGFTGGLGINISKERKFKLMEVAKKEGVRAQFTIKEPKREGIYCYRVWMGAFINWDGTLVPCCNFYNRPTMGNLISNNLEEIWNGALFQKFRGSIRYGNMSKYPESIANTCKNCNITSNDRLHVVGKYFRN